MQQKEKRGSQELAFNLKKNSAASVSIRVSFYNSWTLLIFFFFFCRKTKIFERKTTIAGGGESIIVKKNDFGLKNEIIFLQVLGEKHLLINCVPYCIRGLNWGWQSLLSFWTKQQSKKTIVDKSIPHKHIMSRRNVPRVS